jgi:hypothetical protein
MYNYAIILNGSGKKCKWIVAEGYYKKLDL